MYSDHIACGRSRFESRLRQTKSLKLIETLHYQTLDNHVLYKWEVSCILFFIGSECLDEKMRRERNTKRLQELQQQVVWPTVTDLDPRTYIPEVGTHHVYTDPYT